MGGIEKPKCERCGGNNVKLRRYIISNGDTQFRWQCMDCGKCALKSSQNVSHTQAEALAAQYDKTTTDIPIAADYSQDTACAVCGKLGTEVHHWAPQALSDQFGDDWYNWPTVHLCREHHQQWHRIVTPYLTGE